MNLIEVTDKRTERDFIQVNVQINKNNPNYIQPLNHEINEIFDPSKNKTFRFGKVKRWILKNKDNAFLGRIAAFTNKKYKNKGDEVPIGGIGFFDCIHDQKAADMLFDVCRHWLTQQGVEAMDGPINFGERDRWWGLVVEGFQEPLYGMNYNPPYYKELFENYGFKAFYHQICLGMDPKEKLTAKIFERHALYANNPDFKARHIDKSSLEKFAVDFVSVYNAAWAGHGGLKEMKPEQMLLTFKKMKPVMDERIVWFAYYHEKPIAIFINLPDLNQWFKYLHGKFDFFHKLKFLWIKRTKPCKKFSGLAFGIIPEFQGKGIDAYIIAESAKIIQTPAVPYSQYEMQWIGDFNPKMINVGMGIGTVTQSRKLTTFRYLFDRAREFKRHPMIN